MNNKTIAYSLEYNEAVEMDNLYLENKSFKKQLEVLVKLGDDLSKDNSLLDKTLYYVNTLFSFLYDSKDYDTIDKYLKALQKTEVNTNILLIVVKILYSIRLNVISYEPFKRFVVSVCISQNLDYEDLLKGFYDAD